MGRRRIRLLKVYDDSMEIVGIDSKEDRRKQAEEELGLRTFSDIKEACDNTKNPEAAFVSTSPLSHAEIIKECLNRGLHTFTEINLVDNGYDDNMHLASDKGRVLFLSSTFLYRKEIEFIRKSVNGSARKKSYIYHVGQYLPDWHPWENYKDFFVGKKETNGCRELMTIEFPWIFETFGMPKKWSVQKSRISELDIDYEDSFQIMFSHSDGSMGTVFIDVVSRKPVRKFECIAEDMYLSWDGTPDGLHIYDIDKKEDVRVRVYDKVNKRKDYSPSIIEDAYLAEISEFMDSINGKTIPRYSFEKDKKVLSIIDAIEESTS